MATWHTSRVPASDPYRELPSVDELSNEFGGRLPHPLLVEMARETLEAARGEIARGEETDVRAALERAVTTVRRSAGTVVLNATGVLLHTNLGRALWSEEAMEWATTAATSHTNVELDLESGQRGRRGEYVRRLLTSLTGAEDALIVNNNAAALLLTLAATSSGRAVPVSRGEMIEIGGSYRLPDVMGISGARLVEVGTTNRTRPGDFSTAVQLHDCGALLKVHPSNYRVEGFVETAALEDMSGIAQAKGIPLIYDIGSGLLDVTTPWLEGPPPEWIRGEPAARQALDGGADLVTFSGDKLLGGPQAGVIVGSAEMVSRLRRHALTRAMRVDGVTLAALGATLEAYADRDMTRLPFWRHALADVADINRRATQLAARLDGEVAPGSSAIGAGSVPGVSIPTTVVKLPGEDHLHRCLLTCDPPVLARSEHGALVIDLRTVDPVFDISILEAIERCR